MAIAKAEVTIKGVTPLLQHAFPLVPVEAIEKKSPEEQAEISAYRDPETRELYIPAAAIQRALVSAARFSKGKGRASLQTEVSACVMVGPERVSLGIEKYAVDARAVVNPSTKGRVVRYRPRLDNWKVTFELEWDDTLLKESQVRRVVDDMGSRVGLLDFRPEKKGPFGRSVVVNWKS